MIVQLDRGSAQPVSNPKYLICAHQIKNKIGAPEKKIILLYLIILIFESILLKKMAYDTQEIVYL